MVFFTRNVFWAMGVFAVASAVLYDRDVLHTAKKEENEKIFKELKDTSKQTYASLKEEWKKK